ncbi:DUF1365 domain-containing protein [Marinobacteraceae bacterium S3BR75-40.1]
MSSAFLEGSIRHRRLNPVRHSLSYPIGLYAIDLDRWQQLETLSPWISTRHFNWVWFRRKDYFLPGEPDLKNAVARHVFRETGWMPDGPIELITHPRYLGHSFNPVSFYFCYAADARPEAGDLPRAILAQITNTPWHERHTYCLYDAPALEGRKGWHTLRFQFSKQFHVSPFNPMGQRYDWLFSFRPGETRIHMNVLSDDTKVFDATLVVQRRPLDRITLQDSLRRYPWESLKGVVGIYWHALKLKLKGAPFYTHPDKDSSNRPPDWTADAGNAQTGKVTSWRI